MKSAQDYPSLKLTNRQAAVLGQFVTLITKEGFRHLRVADIAERLGCSPSLLYRISDSRDELVYRAIESWHQRTDEKIRAVNPNQPSFSILKEASIVIADMHDPMSQQAIEDIRATPSLNREMEYYKQRDLRRIESVLKRGIEAGEVAPIDSRLAAGIWYTALSTADSNALDSRGGLSRAEKIEIVTTVISKGLSAKKTK